MGSNEREVKAHAVCIPHPSQGHIHSMLKFAKLLHFKGFHITFVHTETSYNRILESSGPTSLKGLHNFEFRTIPDGLSASESMANGEDLSNLTQTQRFRLSHTFREFLKNLIESTEGPEVTCVVSDTFMSFTLDVSAEFGLPNLSYCSVSACGFMGFFAIKELIQRGIVPLKNEEDLINGYYTPVDCILGLKNMRLRDFTKFVHTTDPNDALMNFPRDETQESLKATAILIHTFDELEGPTLDAMSAVFPAVYAIGPLDLMCTNIFNNSLDNQMSSNFWANDNSCLHWLDQKAPNSIVYVNFGSLAVATKDQLVEFAWGLVNSNYEFLWVIRPDLLVTKDSSVLPKEVLLEVNKKGLLISWCRQQEVLKHPSIGVFLTHCGWNSMMESISFGVPLICWPFFAEQQTNCRYACNEWKIGVEINNDVKRDEVEMKIKEVMEGDNGIEIRRNAMKCKESASEAAMIGGTAFANLDRVIEDILISKSYT